MSQSNARRTRRELERIIANTCVKGAHQPKTDSNSNVICARCGQPC